MGHNSDNFSRLFFFVVFCYFATLHFQILFKQNTILYAHADIIKLYKSTYVVIKKVIFSIPYNQNKFWLSDDLIWATDF